MEESGLEASLTSYRSQVDQVDAALLLTPGQAAGDLVNLKADLMQLIQLTEESLLSLKKSKLLSQLDGNNSSCSSGANQSQTCTASMESSLDAEFAAFQAAIADDISEPNTSSQTIDTSNRNPADDPTEIDDLDEEDDSELLAELNGMAGTKCRVPHAHDWGEKTYHNAMIVCAEPLQVNMEPKVRVFLTHPTHRSLQPCKYFLDGECRFTEEQCHFSHGLTVGVNSLQEYEEPDYSKLKLESQCLAKYTDGVWYPSTVVENLRGDELQVMFQCDQSTHSVGIEDVWPQGDTDSESDSSSSDTEETINSSVAIDRLSSESEDEDAVPVYLWRPGQCTEVMGEWEKHTKGFASKLMAKMGYIVGQGLGKTGQGRTEPVPIQLLPPGKSLDKIMELKELAGDRDLYDVTKRQKHKHKKLWKHKGKGSYPKGKNGEGVPQKKNLFDFLNKKLGKKKGNMDQHVKGAPGKKPAQKNVHISERDLNQKSDQQVNIQILKTHEEMKNVQKEIERHKVSLRRNDGKDQAVATQYKTKISSLETYLQQLRNSESSLQRNQKKRSDNKKLAIF